MIETVPFGTVELSTGQIHSLGDTPVGARTVADITAVRIDAEQVRASMVGGGSADWATIRPDGVIEVDVRVVLETDDGAALAMSYTGTMDFERGDQPVISMFRFVTSDERYAWLNRVAVIGKGSVDAEHVRYELHELR
jgi:hypothetical protein